MDAWIAVTATLTAAAAGITGAWSPCGFSMVDTIGSALPERGRRTVGIACATFSVGAVAGGVATFGLLSLLGALLHAGDSAAALAVGAVVAAAAAIAEALGLRIAPQIRRQVPERWRRTMPLPLAAGLYGVLLGLGFTTFVLTFAVWALAGVSIALGDVAVGLLIGVGFGAGRAIPVVVMATRHATLGARMLGAMATRPALLGGLRRVDAGLLALLAVAIGAGAASAAPAPVMGGALDPAAGDGVLALRVADGALVRAADGERRILGAGSAAPGGPWLVTESMGPGGRGIAVDVLADLPPLVDRTGDAPAVTPLAWRPVAGVSAVAASAGWAAWRRDLPDGREVIEAARLPGLTDLRTVAVIGRAGDLSRPAVEGPVVVFADNTPRRSRIIAVDLESRARATLRVSTTLVQFRDPTVRAGRLLYVRAGYCEQRLRLEPVRGIAGGVTLWTRGTTAERDPGYVRGRTTIGTRGSRCPKGTPRPTREYLDATALAERDAYVSVWRPGAAAGINRARVVRVPLPAPRA